MFKILINNKSQNNQRKGRVLHLIDKHFMSNRKIKKIVEVQRREFYRR